MNILVLVVLLLTLIIKLFCFCLSFKNSLTINQNALADDGIKDAKSLDKFQFERIGYFSVDLDSTNNNVTIILEINLLKG